MSQVSDVRKPKLTNASSLAKSPKFGVETPQEDELSKILMDIDKWGIDVFKLDEYSKGHPLVATMYKIFSVSIIDLTFNSSMINLFLHNSLVTCLKRFEFRRRRSFAT